MTTYPVFGTHDANTRTQMDAVAQDAVRAALMADGHVGYVMPIGGVAAYREQVSVVGVGFDIACGNCAVKLDRHALEFTRTDLQDLADAIQRTISFGVGRTNAADDAPVDHPLFRSDAWHALPVSTVEREQLRQRARTQLGTVGSGNHYVDVFAGDDGYLWVGVHFGSRGLGHTIASGFLALAQGQPWGTRVPERQTLLDLRTELGQAYWTAMELAGEYAYAGRHWVAHRVAQLLGGTVTDTVHNHHNYAWRETHGGEELVVVRKGATPAFPGQRGFVGGSMGDMSVILEGVDTPTAAEALYSTVHGAGRVMSRTEARGKRKGWGRKAVQVGEGRVSWDDVRAWLEPQQVILRGGGVDEAPQVYRRLLEVLRAQEDTIQVQTFLQPLVVVMAGENEYDPYKD